MMCDLAVRSFIERPRSVLPELRSMLLELGRGSMLLELGRCSMLLEPDA